MLSIISLSEIQSEAIKTYEEKSAVGIYSLDLVE